MRTLIIEGDNIDDVRKDVYNFLLGGKYREVVAVKQIKPNYVHVIYVPESKLVSQVFEVASALQAENGRKTGGRQALRCSKLVLSKI